jgi:hypothetical protein
MFKRGTGRFGLVGFLGVCRICRWQNCLRGRGEGFCLGGRDMKRVTPEQRYLYSLRKQEAALNDFIADEECNSESLLALYKQKKRDIPDDVYRACAFFINREYLFKRGSLTLLYQAKEKLQKEIKTITKENAVDVLCYRYQAYAAVLREGGF